MGAQKRGPTAKPRTKTEIPRVAIRGVMEKSVIIWSTPPE
jgi:hypothetical protein